MSSPAAWRANPIDQALSVTDVCACTLESPISVTREGKLSHRNFVEPARRLCHSSPFHVGCKYA